MRATICLVRQGCADASISNGAPWTKGGGFTKREVILEVCDCCCKSGASFVSE